MGVYDLKKNQQFSSFLQCDEDSVFDLASLTKLLLTAPLVAEAELQQMIDPSQTLADISPGLSLPPQVGAKNFYHLLCHESGLPAWHNFWIGRFLSENTNLAQLGLSRLTHIREVFARISKYRSCLPLPCYSDLGYILLGYLLELKTGQSLTQLYAKMLENLQEPAIIGRIGFATQIHSKDFVSTGYCALRKRQLIGEVHDENAAALGGAAGHAGLFGTLPGIVALFQNLLANPIGQFMTKQSRRAFKDGKAFGYGFHKMDSEFSRVFAQGQSWGHLGFTGCGLWYDPSQEKLVILLANRTIYSRLNPEIKDFRRSILSLADQI